MNKYSISSKKVLSEINSDLQILMKMVLSNMDHSLRTGFRSQEEQNKVFAGGASKKKWPESSPPKGARSSLSLALINEWPVNQMTG